MRLIDANALEKTMYSVADLSCSENIHVDVIADIIGNAPTVDAVEVVRCKDCKYAEVADKEDRQDGYTCQFHRGSIWFSGSYCSWAERGQE